MIVSQPDRAVDVLQDKRIAAVVNDVVVVETDDKPGSLSRMLDALRAEDIQIEYTYTAASERPGSSHRSRERTLTWLVLSAAS